jgi:hypothetical protein
MNMSFHPRTWIGRGLVLLVTLVAAASLQAGLTGLVYDADDSAVRVAFIDSGDGSVSQGSAGIDDCCLLVAGLTAIDTDGDRVFSVGQFSGGPNAGDPVLLELSLDGESASQISPAQVPQAVLAWDQQSGRLISAVLGQGPSSTQWIAIDPENGSVDSIGSESTTCCELVAGIADIGELPGGGKALYVVGRNHGESDWQLLAVDLSDGAITSLAPLPAGSPGFMVFDEASGQVDVLMQTALDEPSILYRIDPADGIATELAVNSAPDCCLASPGDMASRTEDQFGSTWWVGGSGAVSQPVPGFFTLSGAESNSLSKRVALDGNLFLHALIVSGTVVNPALLFHDRFEL